MSSLILLCVFLGGWSSLSHSLPSYLLPSPQRVLFVLWEDRLEIFDHFSMTFIEWAAGLGSTLTFALFFALSGFFIKPLRKAILSLLTASQNIPSMVLGPLLITWLGIGLLPKVVFITLCCVFPVTLGVLSALEKAYTQYGYWQSIWQVNPIRMFSHVYFFAVIPAFLNGIHISLSYGFMMAIFSELLGSEKGIGVYLSRSRHAFQTDKLLGATVVIIGFTWGSCALLNALRKRLPITQTL